MKCVFDSITQMHNPHAMSTDTNSMEHFDMCLCVHLGEIQLLNK